MTDLAAFLLARIAEDEAVLTKPEARAHRLHLTDAVGTYSPVCPTCRQAIWGSRQRGLAECAAKRQIVSTWQNSQANVEAGQLDTDAGRATPGLAHVLAILALPYADHPDYDEGWRP